MRPPLRLGGGAGRTRLSQGAECAVPRKGEGPTFAQSGLGTRPAHGAHAPQPGSRRKARVLWPEGGPPRRAALTEEWALAGSGHIPMPPPTLQSPHLSAQQAKEAALGGGPSQRGGARVHARRPLLAEQPSRRRPPPSPRPEASLPGSLTTRGHLGFSSQSPGHEPGLAHHASAGPSMWCSKGQCLGSHRWYHRLRPFQAAALAAGSGPPQGCPY